MKTLGSFCLLLLAALAANAQNHYLDVGAGVGLGAINLSVRSPSVKKPMPMLAVGYRFISKKEFGVSLALEFNGYKYFTLYGNDSKSTTYSQIYNNCAFLTVPLMTEIEGGHKRVRFIARVGLMANFALAYKYDYYSNWSELGTGFWGRKHTYNTLPAFTLVQIGIPFGLGASIHLPRHTALNLSIEDRLFFKSFFGYEGIFNTLALKVVVALNLERNAANSVETVK